MLALLLIILCYSQKCIYWQNKRYKWGCLNSESSTEISFNWYSDNDIVLQCFQNLCQGHCHFTEQITFLHNNSYAIRETNGSLEIYNEETKMLETDNSQDCLSCISDLFVTIDST